MIEFCRAFHVNFSQSRVSNFQNFSGGACPQTPLEDLGPMVKIESTFMRDEIPETLQNPNCAPANLENMVFVALYSSYMMFLVIIERKIDISFYV